MIRPVTRYSRQTPAGEKVALRQLRSGTNRADFEDPLLVGWSAFSSGSMALAAALSFSARQDPPVTRVAMPAYSCPDIAAAAHFAKLDIEFVDLIPDQTTMSALSLAGAFGSGIKVAVVVDLFGARNEIAKMRTAADQFGASIIHDRSQSLAGPGLISDSAADLVVVSRGRGKPATLLGGGATWARNPTAFSDFVTSHFPLETWSANSVSFRAAMYNFALRPSVFGVAAQLPLLHLGETRLRHLSAVTRFPGQWLVHAARQLRQQLATLAQRRARTLAVAELIPGVGFTIPLDALHTAAIDGLNRLPVLCRDAPQATFLVTRGAHLGISAMYGKTLPEFLGMSAADAAANYPVAYQFSRSVVTLPTHARVEATTLGRLRTLLRESQ